MKTPDTRSTPPDGADPSAEQGLGSAAHPNHVARFYESEESLYDAVAGFLTEGLLAGEPLVVYATADHRDAFSVRLASRGVDLEHACRTGELTFLDARAALSTFMTGPMPDEQLFRSSVGGAIERSLRGRRDTSVRAYGEMVDVLWRNGNPAAAIRLEELWKELATTYSFSLLCAYAMGNFYKEAHAQRFQDVCSKHGRVLPAERYTRGGDDEAGMREICRLQQRAQALETEIEHRKRREQALCDALEDRRRAAEALREAKEEAERANRVKSDFLAVMSHELRTPLNAILGYQELLDQEVSGPVAPAQRVYLGRIKSGAQQLLRLVDQILSLSRIEAGKEELHAEPVDLAAIAAEAGALIEPSVARKGLALKIHVPEPSIVCVTDAGKVRQILLNLLSNAAKFTAEGTIRLDVRIEAGFVCFDVQDTGVGIQPADLGRVFEPFVQVDNSANRGHNGTGLGLPVSRDLARLLGGDVTVASTPGEGSVFTFRLPATRHAATS